MAEKKRLKMKKLLIFPILFILSCSTEPEAVHGCVNSTACNYNSSATIDNNTCEYMDNCDVCDNNPDNDCTQDCADVWGGNTITDCNDICGGDNDGYVVLWGECYNIESTTSMDLRSQGLTGSIPSEIGSLTNLTLLNLSWNQLSGSIPYSIGNLTNLIVLNLSYNQLTGGIPSSIGNLPTLLNLYLQSNQLSGEIPVAICESFSNGNFIGTLDSYILEGNNLINTCE